MSRREPGWVAVERLETRRLLSASALVRDFNTAAGSSSPSWFYDLGGGVTLFSADDGIHGRRMWRTDGTAGGTVMVEGTAGLTDLESLPLGVVDGSLYFQSGTTLYKSDGTVAGTATLAADIFGSTPFPGTLVPEADVGFVQGVLYFTSDASWKSQDGLWRTDGTPAGTWRVTGFAGGAAPRGLTELNGRLYFAAPDPAKPSQYALWSSDGTAAGTAVVKSFTSAAVPAQAIDGLTAANGALYFVSNDGATGAELWTSDGTTGGTRMVKDVRPGASGGVPVGLLSVAAVGDVVYFTASSEGTGVELWKTDGTGENTVPVKRVGGEGYWTRAPRLLGLAGRILVGARADDGTLDFWSSDGTDAGTVRVLDGSVRGNEYLMEVVGFQGLAYLSTVGTRGLELVRTDGTASGTEALATIDPYGVNASLLTATSGGVYFVGRDSARGAEPWWSDGTAAGTRLVKDVRVSNGDTFATVVPVEGGPPFLWGVAGGRSVYRMTSEPGGVELVSARLNTTPSEMIELNGRYVFASSTSAAGYELFSSDGTDAGTQVVLDIRPGNAYSIPEDLVKVGGLVFFTADDGVHGRELWCSDGTAEGTRLVRDILPGAEWWTGPEELTELDGVLYFTASDAAHGKELWRSDGTEAGTYVIDIGGPSFRSSPKDLRAASGRLWFTVGAQVWTSDGTLDGTTAVPGLPGGAAQSAYTELGDGVTLFTYVKSSGGQGTELWRSDGTAAGTWLVKDINPGSGSSRPRSLVRFGRFVYFTADDGVHGRELWRTDGTAGGTVMVADAAPGARSTFGDSTTPSMAAFDGWLYFVADDGVHGRELWRSEIGGLGAEMVEDLLPGADGSQPSGLAAGGGALYFRARDGVHGQELWWLGDERAPVVVGRGFEVGRGGPVVRVGLSENVSVPELGAIGLENLRAGEVVSAAAVGVAVAYDRETYTLTIRLPAGLGAGDYRLRVAAGAIEDDAGRGLGAIEQTFFWLNGDANRDRSVDFRDLVVVAQNYNGTGKGFAEGDFNFDGVVDSNDLVILAQGYDTGLAPAPVASSAPAGSRSSVVEEGEGTSVFNTRTRIVARAPGPAPVPVRRVVGRR